MSIKSIKLYHFPATRSVRVKWALLETVGEDFEEEIVPLYEGGNHAPDFLEKNPNHNVPMLEIIWQDGTVKNMLESGAMVALLADAFPGKGLAPPADQLTPQRADYLQMLHFGSNWMDMMLWQIRSHEHLLPEDQRDQRTVERYRQKILSEVEPQLLGRLTRTPFICGDSFTAADILIGYTVGWAKAYRLCRDKAFSNYLRRLSERPAYLAAYAGARDFQITPPEGSPIVSKFTG
jgi:glutathione S-transferase